MSGHTKGPWVMDRYQQLRSPDGVQVGVWGAGISWVSRSDEAEANARLIAAAPDLLEACKALVAAMRRYEVEVDGDAPQAHRDMMDHADAAITRADRGGA